MLGVLVGVAEEREVFEVAGTLFNSVCEVCEEGVADVGEDEADRLGAGLAQGAGLGVGAEAEFGGGAMDCCASFL